MNWQADEAQGEARKGGVLTLSWLAFGARLDLEVRDLIPYQRIVLGHGDSTVELSLTDGGVHLLHSGPEAGSDGDGLRSSWRLALAQLAHCVERHPGKKRSVQWLLRRMRCSAGAAHLCFSEAELLRRWLGQSSTLGDAGSEYELMLDGGQRLSGRVLAHIPGRDVALSCEGYGDSVLGLRTFPLAGAERIVALSWSQWGRPRRGSSEVCEQLARCLFRLGSLLDGCAQA
jgi:hypothetical protein